MTDITVTVGDSNAEITSTIEDSNADINIGIGEIQVVVTSAQSNVANLSDILDVDTTNLNGSTNKYVMVYDATRQKYVFVNPDAVIDASVGITTTDPTPVGMSTATINYLDDVLDNKIDLDAGEW